MKCACGCGRELDGLGVGRYRSDCIDRLTAECWANAAAMKAEKNRTDREELLVLIEEVVRKVVATW